MAENKLPKDLGLKVGSKAEVFWTGVRDSINVQLEQAHNQTLVNKELLVIASRKIKEEQRKAKV